MSETKEIIKLPLATRKKLKAIGEKFSELNIGITDGNLWLGNGNESTGYDWSQFDIGVNENCQLIICSQSGCSCNGPESPTVDSHYSLDKPFEIENGYYGDEKAAIDDLIMNTNILYKVLTGKRVTPKEVISLPNAEIRRSVVEIIGYDKLVKGAITVNKSSDGKLLRIPLENDEDIMLVHVKDPSTDREYFLRVPPSMKTTQEARAWTFGFKANEFILEKES